MLNTVWPSSDKADKQSDPSLFYLSHTLKRKCDMTFRDSDHMRVPGFSGLGKGKAFISKAEPLRVGVEACRV